MTKQRFYSSSVLLLGAVALLAGCATTYQPIIDTKGLNVQKYNQDLAECRILADQVDVLEDGATDALIGAGIGAAAGAALGALTGNAGMGAATGAAVGGFGGGGGGALTSSQRKQKVLNNCLTSRGYRILG